MKNFNQFEKSKIKMGMCFFYTNFSHIYTITLTIKTTLVSNTLIVVCNKLRFLSSLCFTISKIRLKKKYIFINKSKQYVKLSLGGDWIWSEPVFFNKF